jgi:hypothetical protein
MEGDKKKENKRWKRIREQTEQGLGRIEDR